MMVSLARRLARLRFAGHLLAFMAAACPVAVRRRREFGTRRVDAATARPAFVAHTTARRLVGTMLGMLARRVAAMPSMLPAATGEAVFLLLDFLFLGRTFGIVDMHRLAHRAATGTTRTAHMAALLVLGTVHGLLGVESAATFGAMLAMLLAFALMLTIPPLTLLAALFALALVLPRLAAPATVLVLFVFGFVARHSRSPLRAGHPACPSIGCRIMYAQTL